MFWWHFLQRRGLKYPPSRNIAIGIQTVETSDKFGKRMGNNIFWQGKLFSRYFSKNRFSHLQFFLRLSSFEKIVGVYCYFAHYKYLYEQMYTRTLGRLWSCLTSSFAPSGFLENLVILSGSALALFVPEIWGKSKKSIFSQIWKALFIPEILPSSFFVTDGQRSSRLGGFAYKRLYTKYTSTMLEYDSAGQIVCCEHMGRRSGETGVRVTLFQLERGTGHQIWNQKANLRNISILEV